MPWLALYLDGSSWPTIGINFAAWLFLMPIGTVAATVHAIVCLCRSDRHRKYSKPARRNLRYDNHHSANTQVDTEKKAVEPEPEPVPVTRAIAEPPAKQASATSSSTSMSSSDVEKTNPAPAPPPRTATAPPSRAPSVKQETDLSRVPTA